MKFSRCESEVAASEVFAVAKVKFAFHASEVASKLAVKFSFATKVIELLKTGDRWSPLRWVMRF